MRQHFTLEEANALLGQIRPLLELAVAARRRLEILQQRQARLVTTIGGNGGGLDPGDVKDLRREFDRVSAALARYIEQIAELGGEVKDAQSGLVDFPSLRGGEEILLCWQLGEASIGFWHGPDSGFAGRQPL